MTAQRFSAFKERMRNELLANWDFVIFFTKRNANALGVNGLVDLVIIIIIFAKNKTIQALVENSLLTYDLYNICNVTFPSNIRTHTGVFSTVSNLGIRQAQYITQNLKN